MFGLWFDEPDSVVEGQHAGVGATRLAQERWTQAPSEGTPAELTTTSWYHPGGASAAETGSSSSTASGPTTCSGRSTRRCSASQEWVVAPGRSRLASRTSAGSTTPATTVSP